MCGCRKNNNNGRRTPALRPSSAPRPAKGNLGPSPAELRALGMQKAANTENRQLASQKRKLEQLRRESLRRKLGK